MAKLRKHVDTKPTYNLSVLVPIYGVEKYIERYARSLFEQSMTKDVEFVFIDDCSQDNSIRILRNVIEDYPHLKEQIRIEKLPRNLGLLGARLEGLKLAKGNFILCNDSDDWIEPTMLEDMYHKAIHDDCDVVIADYIYDTGMKQCIMKQQPACFDGKSCMNQILNMQMNGSWWNKLFKAELVYQSDFIVPQLGMNMLEDLMLTTQLLYHSKKIGYINKAYYHYCIRPGSVSQSTAEQKYKSMQYAYSIIADFYQKNSLSDKASLYALRNFRISTLSVASFIVQNKNLVDFSQYKYLRPYIMAHPKLSIYSKLALWFQLSGLHPLRRLLIFLRKVCR